MIEVAPADLVHGKKYYVATRGDEPLKYLGIYTGNMLNGSFNFEIIASNENEDGNRRPHFIERSYGRWFNPQRVIFYQYSLDEYRKNMRHREIEAVTDKVLKTETTPYITGRIFTPCVQVEPRSPTALARLMDSLEDDRRIRSYWRKMRLIRSQRKAPLSKTDVASFRYEPPSSPSLADALKNSKAFNFTQKRPNESSSSLAAAASSSSSSSAAAPSSKKSKKRNSPPEVIPEVITVEDSSDSDSDSDVEEVPKKRKKRSGSGGKTKHKKNHKKTIRRTR